MTQTPLTTTQTAGASLDILPSASGNSKSLESEVDLGVDYALTMEGLLRNFPDEDASHSDQLLARIYADEAKYDSAPVMSPPSPEITQNVTFLNEHIDEELLFLNTIHRRVAMIHSQNQEAIQNRTQKRCQGPAHRNALLIHEPIFPTRIECSSCDIADSSARTEFYHITGLNSTATLGQDISMLPKVSVTDLRDETKPATRDVTERLPVGQWIQLLRLKTDKFYRGSEERGTNEHIRWTMGTRSVFSGIPSEYQSLLSLPPPDGHLLLVDHFQSGYASIPEYLTLTCAQENAEGKMIGSDRTHSVEFLGNKMDTSQGSTKEEDWIEWKDKWMDVVQKEDANVNLRFNVTWQEWSCCSACCCAESACPVFGHDTETCKNLSSTRYRIGYLSMFIVDPNKKIDLQAKIGTTRFAEFLDHLQYLLALPPYDIQGLPVFSRRSFAKPGYDEFLDVLLDRTMAKRKEMALLHDFAKAIMEIKRVRITGLGRFFQLQDCDSHPHKRDCPALAQCYGLPSTYSGGTLLPPKSHPDGGSGGGGQDKPDSDDVGPGSNSTITDYCPSVQFFVHEIDKKSVQINIEKGENVLLVVSSSVLNGSQLDWYHSSNKIPEYDDTLTCEQQPLVVAKNKRDLLIQGADDEIVASAFMAAYNGEKVKAKLILEQKGGGSDAMQSGLMWGGIALAVLVVIVIGGLVTRFFRRRRRAPQEVTAKSIPKEKGGQEVSTPALEGETKSQSAKDITASTPEAQSGKIPEAIVEKPPGEDEYIQLNTLNP